MIDTLEEGEYQLLIFPSSKKLRINFQIANKSKNNIDIG